MADIRTVTRLSVCVEVVLDPAQEEAVRWAVERAVEQTAIAAGAEVLRAVVTVEPY